jgi:hypothetical protein
VKPLGFGAIDGRAEATAYKDSPVTSAALRFDEPKTAMMKFRDTVNQARLKGRGPLQIQKLAPCAFFRLLIPRHIPHS